MENPLERLRYHTTGAVERGEVEAVEEIRANFQVEVTVDDYNMAMGALTDKGTRRCLVCILAQAVNRTLDRNDAKVTIYELELPRKNDRKFSDRYAIDKTGRDIIKFFDLNLPDQLLPLLPKIVSFEFRSTKFNV
jgi:hypothetical protein